MFVAASAWFGPGTPGPNGGFQAHERPVVRFLG